MTKTILCLLMFMTPAFAQLDNAGKDTFKKEAAALQTAVNEVIESTVPGMGLLDKPKVTYLDGYGIVITLEVSLEPTRNPFTSQRTPAEIRTVVLKRRSEVQQRFEQLLKERTRTLASLSPTESVTIVLYLFNSNPADLPDMATQLVMTAKKQDAGRVTVREF